MSLSPINWPKVQERLGLEPDGKPGPLTWAALLRSMGATSLAGSLGAACAKHIPAHNIDANARRLSHWLGQNAHESGGFSRLVENLNYTTAKRIQQVWPARFPTVGAAARFVGKPEALANHVYGDRMGNQGGADWGWRYRGRGIKMITGRSNYDWMAGITGLPIVENPDMAAHPDGAVHLSCAFWVRTGCNPLADQDSAARLSNLINRGRAVQSPPAVGLSDRIKRTEKARALLS